MQCSDIWALVDKVQTIAVAGHVRPDGDCVGSCMALARYLRKEYPAKTIAVYFESMPDSFSSLFDKDEYCVGFENLEKAELFFAVTRNVSAVREHYLNRQNIQSVLIII